MDEPWYVNGGEGTLEVTNEDGSWYVTDPEPDNLTVCIFASDEPQTDANTVSVEVIVESFKRAGGTGKNYLTVQLAPVGDLAVEVESENRSFDHESTTQYQDDYPEKSLDELTGSGELVTVEATIAGIEYVKKERGGMPDLKGVLKEVESIKKHPFVVEDGAHHPFFEEGKKLRFDRVVDHYYEDGDEKQVLITKKTDYTELD